MDGDHTVAARIPARLTAAEGRRFGTTVGGAFLVLAGILWWRGRPIVAGVLAALGGVFVLGGLVIPTYLGPVERAWMRMAHLISKVTTPIFMAVMYFVVITPTALLRRTLGSNPLVHRPNQQGYWQPRVGEARRSAGMERQF
jgi:uncharacterized membrane protein